MSEELTPYDRAMAMGLKKPVCINFGYNKFLMEEEEAIKILDWFRASPTVYKVDSKYENGVSLPILRHLEPGEISISVTTQAFILVALENARPKEKT